jgi:hypothetical protein
MVAGFNPLVRQAFPTGGHSAIEVLSPKSGWSYVDPYLDVLAIGGSAQDIAQTGMFQNLRVYPLTDKFREFGSVLTLPDLLKYRTYGDQLGRLPSATMSMLFGRENEYGLQWELNEVPRARPAELFSVSRRIYVRARYIVSEKASVHHTADADRTLSAGRTVASGWVTTSFVTHPLQLVTSASAAFNQNGFR